MVEEDPSTERSLRRSEIKNAVNALARRTAYLKILGSSACAATALHLFAFAYLALFASKLRERFPEGLVGERLEVMLALEISIFSLSIGLLFVYDRVLSQGDVIYQELSDELEWDVRHRYLPQVEPRTARRRPRLRLRIQFREFVSASRLPLARGSYGLMAYVLVNVLILIAAVVALVR